jgi:hypothetical protein
MRRLRLRRRCKAGAARAKDADALKLEPFVGAAIAEKPKPDLPSTTLPPVPLLLQLRFVPLPRHIFTTASSPPAGA